MSPPCVPFFQGDNFGSTYQGVTGHEITVVTYFDVGAYGPTGELEGSPPGGTYVDIDKPPLPACPPSTVTTTDPKECDHILVRMLRGFSRYFNYRYQTYNRHIHYRAYYTSAATAAGRRGDAVEMWERLHPFAIVDAATFNGFNSEFETAVTQLGVLSFGSTQGSLPNAFYRKNAPLAWAFWPDVEHWARMYSSYVCQKVAPFSVKHFGDPPGVGAPNGQRRRFGLWWPDDPAHPELKLYADLVKQQLRACGVKDWMEESYSHSGYAVDGKDKGTEGPQAVARFRGASGSDVTTVLYIGTETRFATAADSAHYYPEIVVAGNLDNDNNFIGSVQNQNVWQNAWAMTFHIRIHRLRDSPGYRAYKEGNPNGDDNAGLEARDAYRDHFMLFQGIQVAGPRLTPDSVDQGFHAIPERESKDPYEAAFFFDPGDYTSVKDAAEEWWDPQGRPDGGGASPGCWRMVNEGLRNLAGDWKGGDQAFAKPTDPCTGYGGYIRLQT